MFSMTIHEGSYISKIKNPVAVFLCLLVRNIIVLIKFFKKNIKDIVYPDKYGKLMVDKYTEAIDLAILYIVNSRVEGDIAEFGSHGTTAKVICKHLSYKKNSKTIHLFDSFKGFPKASASNDIISKVWFEGSSRGPVSSTLLSKQLNKIAFKPGLVKIYEGWFENTLKKIPQNTKFSMLLMDCCMYKSHIEVLTYLFTKKMISEGAIIQFSDWNTNNASNNCGSRKAWIDLMKIFNISSSVWGSYCWGGYSFIIHSYQPHVLSNSLMDVTFKNVPSPLKSSPLEDISVLTQ